MNKGMRAATALAIGYVLGRRKKFRTATLMAAATAVGGTTVGGMVLKRGMKLVNASDALGKVAPQLGDIADVLKGDLLTAGKAAATSASGACPFWSKTTAPPCSKAWTWSPISRASAPRCSRARSAPSLRLGRAIPPTRRRR